MNEIQTRIFIPCPKETNIPRKNFTGIYFLSKETNSKKIITNTISVFIGTTVRTDCFRGLTSGSGYKAL